MKFTLRYTPDSAYGKRFPSWTFGHFATAATGEAVRQQCAHPEQIEVVEEVGAA